MDGPLQPPARRGGRHPPHLPSRVVRFPMLRAALLLVVCSTTVIAAEWPLGRGDARMTGVGEAKLPDQLDERWTFKCKDSVESSPVIADGVVYVASMDKSLYAITLADGKEKWKVKLAPMKASPAV